MRQSSGISHTTNWLAYVSMFVAAASLWWVILEFRDSILDPVVVHNVDVSSAELRPGDEFEVVAEITRNKLCGGKVHEFWRHGSLIFQGQIRAAGPSRMYGRSILRLQKKVPNELTPGTWCYEPVLTYECRSGRYVINTISACFEVVGGRP